MNNEALAWLAGILDGEGSFYIGCKKDRRGENKLQIEPVIRISILPSEWIEKAESILKTHQIPFRSFAVRDERPEHIKNPIFHRIEISAKNGVEKLSRLVLPFMTIKRPQAELFSSLPSGNRIDRRYEKIYGVKWGNIKRWVDFIAKSRELNARFNFKWGSDEIMEFYRQVERRVRGAGGVIAAKRLGYKIWTREEKELLKRLYPTKTGREIAKLLNRSKSSVVSQAWYMGIKKS